MWGSVNSYADRTGRVGLNSAYYSLISHKYEKKTPQLKNKSQHEVRGIEGEMSSSDEGSDSSSYVSCSEFLYEESQGDNKCLNFQLVPYVKTKKNRHKREREVGGFLESGKNSQVGIGKITKSSELRKKFNFSQKNRLSVGFLENLHEMSGQSGSIYGLHSAFMPQSPSRVSQFEKIKEISKDIPLKSPLVKKSEKTLGQNENISDYSFTTLNFSKNFCENSSSTSTVVDLEQFSRLNLEKKKKYESLFVKKSEESIHKEFNVKHERFRKQTSSISSDSILHKKRENKFKPLKRYLSHVSKQSEGGEKKVKKFEKPKNEDIVEENEEEILTQVLFPPSTYKSTDSFHEKIDEKIDEKTEKIYEKTEFFQNISQIEENSECTSDEKVELVEKIKYRNGSTSVTNIPCDSWTFFVFRMLPGDLVPHGIIILLPLLFLILILITFIILS